ncbi:MAG: hypothetical protein WBB01_24450 [Phormidesmis sp.]
MTNSYSANPTHAHQDAEIWQSLKNAITASSGFQRWCSEQSALTTASDDQLVRLYLRDTLETLAY